MPRKNRIHLGDLYFDVAHRLGDFVYLRVRDDPVRGQVTGYDVAPGLLIYCVSWGPDATERRHYDFELSTSAFVGETDDNESDPDEQEE